MQQILKRCARNSELARERLGAPKRLAYGPTPIEGLDVYLTKAKNAPVNIFVHGGAWRAELARDYGYPAEMFVSAGAHLVVPDFNNVIETGGNLMTMAEQVRRAVIWVWKNAESFGGDPERIYVSGHSSGGHLAAVLLTTDFLGEYDLPPNIIKGGVCASGMYDLKAGSVVEAFELRQIHRRDRAETQSPAQYRQSACAGGGGLWHAETPEFQRQSRDFAAAVEGRGQARSRSR